MVTRRGLLAGMLAAGLTPRLSWADAGAPKLLAAARLPSGDFALAGLDEVGNILFQIPLPGRGHAGAAHPERPEAVAFARRPGTFAHVLDCARGTVTAELAAPEGRHFYGHGVFSLDGARLYTTENDYENARGVIGIWDAEAGYLRIGELDSGGVGPHEMRRLPDSDILVIANGGIETHPEAGRAKLNLPLMQPNLSLLDPATGMIEQAELPAEWHMNSIRHLALRSDGLIAFVCQWQGAPEVTPPLLGLYRQGDEAARLYTAPPDEHRELRGYAGSAAFSGDGTRVALTSPRGGRMQIFDAETGEYLETQLAEDVCGLAPGIGAGFVMTTGQGAVLSNAGPLAEHALNWDNHLVTL